jgi:DNA polymerase III gamma/tau subunit
MRLVEKYRPARLEDVIGQEKAIAQLRRILKRGIGGRALLFEGPSGVGKTTTALILARMLEIMGDNETLESLQKGSSMDLRFFEANKMDSGAVDSIKDFLKFAAWKGEDHYKMFIIDEAQTMTKGGANGLLSLLEALPSYVVLVLTTTAAALQEELFKQESAFGSRCLTVSFEVAEKNALAKRLGKIALAEVGDEAGTYAARFDEIVTKARGNVRAAVQLLDTMLDQEAA